MPLTVKYIMEETAGHGPLLCFPGVSSCVVVVARTDTELVGWHVTARTLAAMGGGAAGGFAQFTGYVADSGPARELYIVGFAANHDVRALRNFVRTGLGAAELPANLFNLPAAWSVKTGTAYHVFFRHDGGAAPQVEFKSSDRYDGQDFSGFRDGEGAPLPIHNRTLDLLDQNLHSIWKWRLSEIGD